MSKTLKQRSEIDKKYKWNIEDMYADEKIWEKDVKDALEGAKDFAKYQGKLTDSADILLEALKAQDEIWQKVEKAYVYSHEKRRRQQSGKIPGYERQSSRCYC